MEFVEIVKTALTSDTLALFVIIMLFYIIIFVLKEITNTLVQIYTDLAIINDNIKDIQSGNVKRK